VAARPNTRAASAARKQAQVAARPNTRTASAALLWVGTVPNTEHAAAQKRRRGKGSDARPKISEVFAARSAPAPPGAARRRRGGGT